MRDQWLSARLFRRAFLFSLLFAVLAAPVQAQDSASLARELDRLKRDIADLQRTVYAGRQPPAVVAESEDSAQVQGAARQQLRIQALERELRELTGALEEVRYQVDTIGARVDKLIGDVDFRLQALEQRLSGDGPPAVSEAPGGLARGQTGQIAELSEDGTTIITSQGAVGPGSQTLTVAEDGELRPGQRLLGQLTQSEIDSGVAGQQTGGASAPTPIAPEAVRQQTEPPALPQAAPLQGDVVAQAPAGRPSTVSLPDGTPREQYDFAFDLLRQRDFPAAESALKAFLERNSDGPLAANAMYWLGETHYARENFRDAATVFLDAYTNFPMESKASHSLLKLGMSLGALGKNEQACLTFDELRTKYRDTEPRVLNRADAEAEKLACP